MTDIERTKVAEQVLLAAIRNSPRENPYILFECLEKDLRFYKLAASCPEVLILILNRQIGIGVVSVQRKRAATFLQDLDDGVAFGIKNLN